MLCTRLSLTVVAMLLLVAALLPLVVCRPGSPWTEEEALIVKAKLYAIIGEYGNRVRQTHFLHRK